MGEILGLIGIAIVVGGVIGELLNCAPIGWLIFFLLASFLVITHITEGSEIALKIWAISWAALLLIGLSYYGLKKMHSVVEHKRQERAVMDERERQYKVLKEQQEWRQQEQERVRRENAEKERLRKEREARKEEKIKDFAINEAPQMWQTYVMLDEAIKSQSARLEDLRKTLISFERDPEQDDDYKKLIVRQQEMKNAKNSLHEKIKTAYIQYCKFRATPESAELKKLHERAMEDGIREADATMKRYHEMAVEK